MKKVNLKSIVLFFSLIVLGVFVHGCSGEEEFSNIDNDDIIKNANNFSLKIADFENWFKSQGVANELIGEQEPNWSNAELKLLPDENSLQVSIEIYKGKNSSGNDSIRKLLLANVKNSFIGGVKVFSFCNKENAHVEYYGLSGRILEEGEYFTSTQQCIVLKRYTVKRSLSRLRSGTESNDPCVGTQEYSDSATPLEINGVPNPNAYNCHAYVWGYLSPSDPCYLPDYPHWNNCPNISGSGYSQIGGAPQVGDRWVSYGYDSNLGNTAIHSAIIKEVKNGKVTKLEAKCADGTIQIYNPDCSTYSVYMTDDVRIYR
jgi:hypothetical protein